ncbi:hypothetical protein [Stutzerimonas kunmingensis]|uniref:hypothetical protein n=1 Tax=Stutzerimonas kunmingensis TaxID=1211807 RepID=UPI002FC6FBBB
MTAAITPVRVAACPETPDGIGYEVKRVFPNWASAQRGKADLDAINPAAFQAYTPGLCAGEPMDAPEFVYSPHRLETTAPPNCEGYGQAAAAAQLEAAVGEGEGCSTTGCVLRRDEP